MLCRWLASLSRPVAVSLILPGLTCAAFGKNHAIEEIEEGPWAGTTHGPTPAPGTIQPSCTGLPASTQPLMPPSRCAMSRYPSAFSDSTASAERPPDAQ